MDRFKARFEQNRGHFLVIEGDPPFSRGACDEFQLRMLQTCEIPGLIRPDVEELDGNICIRYPLQGGRMLSQVMRAAKWSMTDWLTALCRLAEILEESRLFFLDGERIRLDDEWIFVGGGWQELKLVYLPLPEAAQPLCESLERLIVRWIVQVPELEGPALQQVIGIVRSPDFTTDKLRRYLRGYLADKALRSSVGSEGEVQRLPAGRHEVAAYSVEDDDSDSAEGWRWFKPTSEEAQPLSGLLGIEPAPFGREHNPPREDHSDSRHRRRIWLICAAFGLCAVAWRAGMAVFPGKMGVLFSAGATLAVFAGVLRLWKRRTIKKGDHSVLAEAGDRGQPWSVVPRGQPAPEPIMPLSEAVDKRYLSVRTGLLASSWQADLTQQLDNSPVTGKKETYYLEWESGRPPSRIPLQDSGLIIGRSPESVQHIDESQGISRIHVELILTPGGWKAKDLGSRNGTRLNDKPMVPYESYLLKPEDSLCLAESRYRFKRGSQV